MSKRVFLIVALISLVWNLLLAVYFKGYDAGSTAARGFLIADESGQMYLFRCYVYISFLHLAFIVGSFIKNRVASSLICLGSWCLALFNYSNIYAQKAVYLDRSIFEYSLPESRSTDAVGIILLLSLIAAQLTKILWKRQLN